MDSPRADGRGVGVSLPTIAATVLIAVPVCVTLAYVLRWGVNVPYWDEWELVPDIDKMQRGELALSDLFAQHNEHRILWARTVMLAVARWGHWDTRILMWLSYLLLVVGGAVLLWENIRSFGFRVRSLLLFLPVAWVFFGVRQWENLLWGWQIQFMMCSLAVVVSAFFVSTAGEKHWRFAAGTGAAVAGTFTIAGGLGLWLAGAAQLVALHLAERKAVGRRHLARLAIWGGAAVATGALYFFRYTKSPGATEPKFLLEHPWVAIRFWLVALGGSLTGEAETAVALGAVMIAVAGYFVWAARRGELDVSKAAFGVPLVVFSLIFAAMVTLGRGSMGDGSALSSRYATALLLAPVGLHRIGLALRAGVAKQVLLGVMVALTTVSISNYASGSWAAGRNWSAARSEIAQIVREYAKRSDDELKRAYPSAQVVRERAKVLEKHRLSVFAP